MQKKKVFGGILFYVLFTLFCILSLFSISQAQVWEGDYTIETSDDIVALYGYTEVTGTLLIGCSSVISRNIVNNQRVILSE